MKGPDDAYDADNRLIQVDGTLGTCSTATAFYLYDALGLRTEKITGSTKTDYAYDLAGNALFEMCGSGCVAADYLYLGGQLIGLYKNNTTYFFHGNHLGSTHLVSDVTGAYITDCFDYLPFGEANVPTAPCSSGSSAPSHSNTSHEFTGDERDSETSLDHTLFRQYSSQFARWTSPDPAGLAAVDPSNPQSWNRYAYVGNNAMNFLDPSGLG